ncbi:MAG: O-antigen ligase family protein [Lachnospiraceae bacterium]|nr:O-antigen ligase family protein [Lachnospiraceae bacterium]
MEGKKQGAYRKALKACFEKIKGQTGVKDIVNTVILFDLFLFYTLTFFVPKFYGLTEKYVGVFVFANLAVLFAVNVNPITAIRKKDIMFIVLAALSVIAIANILIVDSGFGCFFVAVNFALIWYLCDRMPFHKWQFYLFGGLYTLMMIYWFFGVYTWMFADYTSFAMNTNTAATFTVFSMLCVLAFLEELYEKYRIAGLFITIALIKCFQISLYHRSRGAFVMLGAYFVLRYIVPKKLWEKKGFFGTVCVLCTLGSLVFVALYIIIGTTGVNFRMPFFYKNVFSGREAIWLEFWDLFKHKPLTGIGTNVTITSFFEFNVHNAMLNILVIHGVLVFALTLILMYGRWKKSRTGKGRAGFAAAVAVFAVCFESFFDVDLIWTNYTLNVFFPLLVMMSGRRDDTEIAAEEE